MTERDFNARCDRLESELDALLSPEELKRIRDSETRRAEPHDLAPVELPNLRAPRLPTFFADPITGWPTELPTDDCDEQEENGK